MSTTTPYPATTRRFSIRLASVRFPQCCVSCNNPPQTPLHVVGTSRRAWIVLSVICAAGAITMAGYSLTYERPLYTALGMLNVVGLLAIAYLLFYWALLVPALAFYRYLRRVRGMVGAILGALPAGVLWLCMAVYGPTAADDDDTVQTIGLMTGLFLTALFIVHVNSRLHLELPCCIACRKSAADSVRITDYFPLKGRAELQFQSRDYAEAFAQANYEHAE